MRATAIADSATLPPPLTAVIALNVAHEELDEVTRTLAEMSEIRWFGVTTRQFDIIVLAQFRSTEELNQSLRTKLIVVKGIKESETFVCLHVYKGKQLLSID